MAKIVKTGDGTEIKVLPYMVTPNHWEYRLKRLSDGVYWDSIDTDNGVVPQQPKTEQEALERGFAAIDDDHAELFESAPQYYGYWRECVEKLRERWSSENTGIDLDTFLGQYIVTALWSSNDESTPQGGNPLDDNYTESDIADSTRAAMRKDCALFIERAGAMIEPDWTRAAHDFWLTRNGHGAGFWDGDWPEHGDALTALCKEFGEADLYVGDDGQIYQSGTEDYPT